MEGVGPMPVDLFLETFLPHPTQDIPSFENVKFSKVSNKPRKKSEIYSPLVSRTAPSPSHLPSLPTQRDVLNQVYKDSGSKLAFYDTSNQAESPCKVRSSKPELGMFDGEDVNGGVYTFIEVKPSHDLDPFTDPPDSDIPPEYRFTIDPSSKYPGDKKAKHRVLALCQSTRYAHVIQTR